MSDAALTIGLLLGPALGGFLIGALVVRLLTGAGRRVASVRTEDVNHRVRALEADLRVAQRTAEQARAERTVIADDLARATEQLAALSGQTGTWEDRLRKLKSELQHECAKTAKLRQELADRAEEMVRTSVQLRDVQNELGVNQVGSDVILEQIARLEHEREDLNTLVETLRAEMAARAVDPARVAVPPAGPNALMDC